MVLYLAAIITYCVSITSCGVTVAREGFRYAALLQQRHTKYGRIRGMVVGEGGRSTGVILYLQT